MRFRVMTPMSEVEVLITELPEAIEIAERNMEWLREVYPEYENVRIILEVVE